MASHVVKVICCMGPGGVEVAFCEMIPGGWGRKREVAPVDGILCVADDLL